MSLGAAGKAVNSRGQNGARDDEAQDTRNRHKKTASFLMLCILTIKAWVSRPSSPFWGAWGDGSFVQGLATQTLGPEFESQAPI